MAGLYGEVIGRDLLWVSIGKYNMAYRRPCRNRADLLFRSCPCGQASPIYMGRLSIPGLPAGGRFFRYPRSRAQNRTRAHEEKLLVCIYLSAPFIKLPRDLSNIPMPYIRQHIILFRTIVYGTYLDRWPFTSLPIPYFFC